MSEISTTYEPTLDVLKTIAIVAVIALHIISPAIALDPKNLKTYVILDQTLRFCVPLFVGLSGYTLAKKHLIEKINLATFFKKRALKLIPWYLFWSVLIFITADAYQISEGPNHFISNLIFGHTDYHLYFVPMIFQLYILFPLLAIFYKKLRFKFVIIMFAVQAIFFTYLSKLSLAQVISDQAQYIMAFSWIFYFVLGISLSDISESSAKTLSVLKKVLPLLFILSLYWVITDCLKTAKAYDLIIVTRFTRLPVMVYSTLTILSVILYKDLLRAIPAKVFNHMAAFGRSSYIVYLCHTTLLRMFMLKILPTSYQNSLTLLVLVVVSSGSVAYLSINVTNKIMSRIKPA